MSNTYSAGGAEPLDLKENRDSGVAWSAIIGGTVTASAFIVLLAPLGACLGVSWLSPWHEMDSSQKTFTLLSAVWLIIVQWISSGMGGYLTGRLRTAWEGAHTHEVFFRDTAHGFLTWALTTVIGVMLLSAGFMHAAERHSHGGEAQGEIADAHYSPVAYAVSKLFRTDQGNTNVTEQDRSDASVVVMEETNPKTASEADEAYLTKLVAARTGLSQVDAQKRVDDTISQLREDKKAAHKMLKTAAILGFLSMWIGALIASAAGALGGAHRDLHYRYGRLSED